MRARYLGPNADLMKVRGGRHDTGEARHSYTYAKTGWAVLGQPGAIAYQIYDQKSKPLLNKRYEEFSHPIEADTIDELAKKIGIEPIVLRHSIDQFNNA